ncbi:N-formylglutamate amidohydrolase [Thalassobius sp. MITS945101]|uniref:N-formylglutamate amidohydrolase n=1 Tax=Thalassobius sp. MITS945101 TaxID=3096994 RepID=UPI0039995E9A
MSNLVVINRPLGDALPLVFDSPHSGSIYPEDFNHVMDRMTLRRSEDAHIEELFSHVPDHGATLVHALFPRCYIDPNRNEDDLDVTMFDGVWPHPVNPTHKTKARGIGLIWKNVKALGAVYDRKLTVAEVEKRLNTCWRPYHAALQGELDRAYAAHGKVVHVDCHSMASHGDHTTEDGAVRRPDFVIGDRDGTTCDPRLTTCVIETLQACGYSVSLNDPYKGFELVRRSGDPANNRHSIQIEVNRGLYMCEKTISKTDGYLALQENLKVLTKAIAELTSEL